MRTLAGRFFALSARKRRLFLEALVWLALARLAMRIVAFRRIAPPLLGRPMAAGDEGAQNDDARLPDLVGWAVRTAGRHTPWQSKCLVQAIAARLMLKTRRCRSTLYLGVARGTDSGLQAHAWLCCGSRIVTGAAAHRQFTVIARFG